MDGYLLRGEDLPDINELDELQKLTKKIQADIDKKMSKRAKAHPMPHEDEVSSAIGKMDRYIRGSPRMRAEAIKMYLLSL